MIPALKKRSLGSKKEKERKILDFKFRALELLELYIQKSKNPIYSFLPKLLTTLNEIPTENKIF